MHDDPEQFDLFAWPSTGGASRPPAIESPAQPPIAIDVEALPAPDLLRALERLLDGAVGAGARVIGEVARRHLTEAIPMLVQICRLHAGFDRARRVPEVTAALEALCALAAVKAAADILRLVEQDALGAGAIAAALRFFAAARHRPAAGFARRSLSHAEAAVRADACALVAALGECEALGRLRELGADIDAGVAAAADLARGHLGDHAVKPVLEQRLCAAPASEISRLARALVGVADADSVVHLGRAAQRADSFVRPEVVEALGQIDAPTAIVWLVRFAGDEHADVRLAAARALTEHDDPRAAAALRSLAEDVDPEVRETALAILCEFDQPG